MRGEDPGMEAPTPVKPRVHPLASLQVPSYRIYLLSMFMQFTGFNMDILARSWFTYELTDSVFLLGVVAGSSQLPLLVLGVFGGTLADRFSKRNIMALGQIIAAASSLIVAIAASFGAVSWWYLLAASIIQGLGFTLAMPTRLSIVPELVGKPLLLNAMSLSAVAFNIPRVLAPAIGGFLITILGLGNIYYLIFALYSSAFLTLLILRPPRPQTRTVRWSMLQSVAEAVGYIRRQELLILLLMSAFASVSLGVPVMHMLPVFSENVLGVGPRGLGFMLSAAGIGAVASSVGTASVGDFRRKGLLLMAFMGVLGVSVTVFSTSRIYLVSLVCLIVIGMGQAGRQNMTNTLIQSYTDPQFRTRAAAINSMVVGVLPLSLIPMSAIAAVAGAPITIGGAGLLLTFAAVGLGLYRRQLLLRTE